MAAFAFGMALAELAQTIALSKKAPPQLTAEEQQALDNKAQGLPYDKRAYNSARRKQVQAEKFAKERNKQKREGN
jgi:hypothetical protein